MYINLSKQEQWLVRGRIFRHQDGICIIPMVASLKNRGIFDLLEEKNIITMNELFQYIGNCNQGYINVSMRLLATQGWIVRETADSAYNTKLWLTEKGTYFLEMVDIYLYVNEMTKYLACADEFLFKETTNDFMMLFKELCKKLLSDWHIPLKNNSSYTEVRKQVINHADGMIFGFFILSIANREGFKDVLPDHTFHISEFSRRIGANEEIMELVFKIMEKFGWVNQTKNIISLNKYGIFAIAPSRAMSYGIRLAYAPAFCRMEDFLFGDTSDLREKNSHVKEKHIIRSTNITSSGSAHEPYFKKITHLIVNIFNQPIELQPHFVADMGCGDGFFLKSIYYMVMMNTLRGRLIKKEGEKHRLLMIGCDYNLASREVTRINLSKEDIPNLVVFGDINNPDRLKDTLQEHGIDITAGLHVRSFVDHNRSYTPPKNIENANKLEYKSRGTFVYKGEIIDNKHLLQNGIEHLSRWKKYIKQHGLLIIEHHILDEEYIANNLGSTLATSHDSVHGWSDQYSIEYDIWLDLAKESGFMPVKKYEVLIPNKKQANISINYFLPT